MNKVLLSTLFLLTFTGCASYKTSALEMSASREEKQLYAIIPRHRSHIRWYDLGHWMTWAIFGNDDDGIFGESQTRPYKPQKPNGLKKAISWWARNPLHNFTHYAIGSAHRVNSEFTILNIHCRGTQALHYAPAAKHNYGCNCSSFFLALHGGKPFISLRINYSEKRKGEFYLGWRKEGNFGVKFHPFKPL